MRDQETVQQLRDLLESAGAEVVEYSGRGMGGAVCLGVSTQESPFRLYADLVEATQGDLELVDVLADAFRDMCTDSLGRGTVLYFPNYQEDV